MTDAMGQTSDTAAGGKPCMIVIGNGMVGHRFVQVACERGLAERWSLLVVGEENRTAYDRVHLSRWLDGAGDDELSLVEPGEYERLGVAVILNDAVIALDRAARAVTTASGRVLGYDKLVLATGSLPFVPEIEGRQLPGCFVYRTLDDLAAIRAAAASAQTAAVIGGGLLGLEAAGALRSLGMQTHVIELAPRLMPVQIDDAAGSILRGRIEALGVAVHLGKATCAVLAGCDGRARGLRFADGGELAVDLVVFSAGIRPRDELARGAQLTLGKRGGIAIDAACRTSDADILAIGECAAFEDRCFGLVAPGYRMAATAAATLAGEAQPIDALDTSAQLKLLGVEVGSFGDALAATPGARVVSLFDGASEVYKKLVLSADGKHLTGGVLVGDASAFAELYAHMQSGAELPEHPEDLILPPRGPGAPRRGVDGLAATATICTCHNIDKRAICGAIRAHKLTAVSGLKACTRAGTGCGSCVPMLAELLRAELSRAGVTLDNHLCEHFAHSRQQLFHLVRVQRIRSFDELIERHGSGDGCEICKPAVASILASIWNEYVLSSEHAGLQDTNDRFLANIQRDGTYSVVPRLPAGEVTPDQLIALGQIAKSFGLYTKVTGGQRIDMFGARLEQLPAIWAELVANGFESGHAYGKALRTVKSCVGSTWCRYGVQDSVALAVRIENRYKGLRSPHKLKGAVSGCARECAEAQSKDFGVIATEKGYNLYVCGNGGMKPQHAVLLASDIDETAVLRYLDRFLMFYVRTADRLQRTAPWFNQLEGGIAYLTQVIVHDSLGIAAELEQDMAHVIATQHCEWKTTIEDPERLRPFRTFINSDAPDPSIMFVEQRTQHRPATFDEKQALAHAGRLQLPVLPQ